MTSKEKAFFSIIFDLFRSLNLSIFLLILLAILSIIGTVITQNATRPEYIQRYGIALYEVLNFFNLFDMYHSWWFSAILLLLVINLIACSVNRLPGIWRQVFDTQGPGELKDSLLKTLPYVEKIRNSNPTGGSAEEHIQSYLKRCFKSPRRIETESSITLFSEKGRLSRFGVPITHLSILIILVGGLLGSLFGFKGFVNILEGETVNQVYQRMKDQEVAKPLDFKVRCDDFNITFYDLPDKEKHVKDYTSVLTVLEDGKEVIRRKVEVNHPLQYKGLSFYQSSYGALHDVTLGIQWKNKNEKTLVRTFEGGSFSIPNSGAMIRLLRYVPQVHNFGEGAQVVLFRPNQEPRAFWVLKNFPQFGQQGDEEFILSFEGVASKEYTGLQVTKDPGVLVVWIGSGLMIFGFIVSFFFFHQRVWIRIPKPFKGEVILAGSVSKNRIGFEKTFEKLVEGLRDSTKIRQLNSKLRFGREREEEI